MTVAVAIEAGAKKVFAVAVDWPGWARAARDEAAAVETLAAYAPRYAAVAGRGAPRTPRFEVVQRVRGDAGTDFGVPSRPLEADERPLEPRELRRQLKLLDACLARFERACDEADGIPLRKGPRGGGRDLAKIRAHVTESALAYLDALGMKPPDGDALAPATASVADAIDGRLRGDIPARSPRGRVYWAPRFALRRAAWHLLDHAWEIEDRAEV